MVDTVTDRRRMLRVPEAAIFLGISPSYLNALRMKGGGPQFIRLGRAVVYDRRDLDLWLKENRRASVSDEGRREKGGPADRVTKREACRLLIRFDINAVVDEMERNEAGGAPSIGLATMRALRDAERSREPAWDPQALRREFEAAIALRPEIRAAVNRLCETPHIDRD